MIAKNRGTKLQSREEYSTIQQSNQVYSAIMRGIGFASLNGRSAKEIQEHYQKRFNEGRKNMKSETESKVPYLAIAIAVGAVGSLIAAALACKETREKVLERGSKSLDYLKEQGQRLRESSKVAIEKGRNFIGCQCHESAQENSEGERQAHEEERREVMGG